MGFDAEGGTLKAKLNVLGSQKMKIVAQELGVKYQENGAIVLGFDGTDRKRLEELLHRGNANGVKRLRLLEQQEFLLYLDEAICALLAPTSAIVCPYELAIAAVGNTMDNVAELRLNYAVREIAEQEDGFEVSLEEEKIRARIVINAAGLYADVIMAAMYLLRQHKPL